MTLAGYDPATINWDAQQRKASQMTKQQLQYAIDDCLDAIDAGVNPGKYKDQISVYRKALQKRD